MNDQTPSDRFSAYYDGELSSAEIDALRAEVERSEGVRRELGDYEQLSQFLRELPIEGAGDDFRVRVMQAAERRMLLPAAAELARGHRHAMLRSRWFQGLSALTASAAVLFLTVYLLDNRSGHEMAGVGDSVSGPAPTGASNESSPLDGARIETAADSSATPERTVSRYKAGPAELPPPESPADNFGGGGLEGAGTNESETPGEAMPSLSNTAGLPHNFKSGKAGRRSKLEFRDDINKAQIGEIVEALDRSGDRISVVRLTVVDRMQGVEHLQVLLAENDIRVTNVGENVNGRRVVKSALPNDSKRVNRDLFTIDSKTANEQSSDDDTLPSSGIPDDELVCVLVNADSDKLSAALWGLREESQFQDLELEELPIEIAKLDDFVPVVADADSEGIQDESSGPVEAPRPPAAMKPGAELALKEPGPSAAKKESRRSKADQARHEDETAPALAQSKRAFMNLPRQQTRLQLPSRVLSQSAIGEQLASKKPAPVESKRQGSKDMTQAQSALETVDNPASAETAPSQQLQDPAASHPVQVLLVLVERQPRRVPSKVTEPNAAPAPVE